MKLEIYDTTLRDGEQTAGVSFTSDDKIAIIKALDSIGCDCVEAGCFMPQSRDIQENGIFSRLDELNVQCDIAAFASTRHPNAKAENDASLVALAKSSIKTAALYGKSWLYQVENVLHTTDCENLEMISDSVGYLKGNGKRVVFDCEHFFDGYSDNPDYAVKVVHTALKSGADTVVLCDTNGGNLPDVIGLITQKVKEEVNAKYPKAKIGIHCHNDLGMAVSGTLEAVISGAAHVQGSICGLGERCGNSDLCTLIPVLQLKMGFECVDKEKLSSLTSQSRLICEIANLPFNERAPFVGGYAFAHKAGTHIDGVLKSPKSFEHIEPSIVGNERNSLVSSLSGRAAIAEKVAAFLPGVDKNSPQVEVVLKAIQHSASNGYMYENAESSLYLKIREVLGMKKNHFTLLNYQITINESQSGNGANICTAMIKIQVDGDTEITAAEGEGPVNAFDLALRKALKRFYPEIQNIRLTDYKVRVIDSSATASKVRVFVESTDGHSVWRTMGVSADIVEASRQALIDSIEYMLIQKEKQQL